MILGSAKHKLIEQLTDSGQSSTDIASCLQTECNVNASKDMVQLGLKAKSANAGPKQCTIDDMSQYVDEA